MTREEHVRDGRIRYGLPAPIAVPWRLHQIARSPAVRLAHALGTLDHTVRFLTYTLLADYLGATATEPFDAEVETALAALERPTTPALLRLLQRLASSRTPRSPFSPDLYLALSGDAGAALAQLVELVGSVPIGRESLPALEADALTQAIVEPLGGLLGGLVGLEHLVVVRPEPLSAHDPHLWLLHPYRGVGTLRPLVITAGEDALLQADQILLLDLGHSTPRPALRLDPFLSGGGDGRLLMLAGAPGLVEARFSHYASGSSVLRDLPLNAVIRERAIRVHLVPLDVEGATWRRLREHVVQSPEPLPGYELPIFAGTDANGTWYRAWHAASQSAHSVQAFHEPACRDPAFVRGILDTVASVRKLEPPVAAPVEAQVDVTTGRVIVGTAYPESGRLSDRMPPGAPLPVLWATTVVESILAALVHLDDAGVRPDRVVAPAVVVGPDGTARLVPDLSGRGGHPADLCRDVAELFFRMLTGEPPAMPTDGEWSGPSLLRRTVSGDLDTIVVRGLGRHYADPRAMHADVREALNRALDSESGLQDMAREAAERAFGHLQALWPFELDTLAHRATAALAALSETPNEAARTDRLAAVETAVVADWDADRRLEWALRVHEAAERLDPDARQALLAEARPLFKRLVQLAPDHLATLRFLASTARDTLRGADLVRLHRRMQHAARSDAEEADARLALGRLWEERRDVNRALVEYRRVASIQSGRTEAWEGLARLLRLQDEAGPLAEALEGLLGTLVEPAERAGPLLELLHLRAGRLGDPSGAFDLAAELDQAGTTDAGRHQVLVDAARALADDRRLVEALARVAAEPGAPGPVALAARLEEATVRGLRLGESDAALALVQAHKPSRDATAWLSLEATLLDRAGRHAESVPVLETWADQETDPWRLGRVLRRLARLEAGVLHHAERAIALYEGVLETDPGDAEALTALEGYYRERRELASLAMVLRARIDRAPSRQARLDALSALLDLEQNELGDVQAAFLTARRLLLDDPRRPGVLDRFAALADLTSGWSEAQDVLDHLLPHLPADQARSWRLRFGRQWLGGEQATDLPALVAYFERAVADAPGDVAALEGLADATARQGDWLRHAEVLEGLVAAAEEPEARAARLHGLATALRDRVLAPARAAEVYDRILAEDPDDLDAVRGLVQIGEVAGRSALARVEALRRLVALAPDPVERLRSFEGIVRLGDAADLDPDEVAVCWEELLELDPTHAEALLGLELHHRRRKAFDLAAEMLERRIDAATPGERARLVARLGELALTELADPARAEVVTRSVFDAPDADPAHQAIVGEVLVASLEAQGRLDAAVLVLERMAETTSTDVDHGRALVRLALATARVPELGDAAAALVMERALEADRNQEAALQWLARYYVRTAQVGQAAPVLEALTALLDERAEAADVHARSTDSETRHGTSGARPTRGGSGHLLPERTRAHRELGECLAALAESDRAVDAFARTLLLSDEAQRRGVGEGLDAERLAAERGLARLDLAARRYDLAEQRFRGLLDRPGDALTDRDLAEIHAALSEIARARGDDRRVLELHVARLRSVPNDETALREVVRLSEAMGDFEAATVHLRRLAAAVTDPLERFAALIALADVLRDRLHRLEEALTVLEEARRLRPDSTAVAVKRLDVELALGRHGEAVDTLQALLERETDRGRRARFSFTLAILFRDHLLDPRRALRSFDETLEADPTRLEAFEALDRLLVKYGDYTSQADAYRTMLRRLETYVAEHPDAGDDELTKARGRLWKNLGRLLSTVLDDISGAAEAFGHAVAIDPGDSEARLAYAKALESRTPGSEEALGQYRLLLETEAANIDHWRAIERIFARRKDLDAVYCVCDVLRVVGEANERERAFFDRYNRPALALKRGLAGPADWERFVYDDGEEPLVGRIFEILARALGPKLSTRTLKDLGLGPEDVISLRQQTRFTSFLGTVGKVLDVPIPAVYRSKTLRGVRKEAMWPPALVAGAEVITGRKGKELRFQLGKAMAYFTPPHLLAGMFPAGHLRTLLTGAMRAVLPGVSHGGEPGIRGVIKALDKALDTDRRAQLEQLCTELLERPAAQNLNGWLNAVECTANRAGLLLSSDYEVAVRIMKEERQLGIAWSKLPLKDAAEDLARYAVSQKYLELRRELGAAVGEDE